jgi:hypothetical protein
VNATLKSDLTKSYEIPFQIEDWGSHYQVPYGITSNTAIFNENCMIVFLVNHTVDHVTVWWDGRDTAVQTPYTTPTKFNYFANDDTSARHLSNGIINLDINLSGDGYVRASTASGTPVNSEARFLRVNNRVPGNGAQESYIIYHGVVRDIVQQESEWGGGVTLSPNIFSHMVFTLPAKANYYTYQLRMIFVDSSQTRTLSDLSLIRLYGYIGSQKSEDGVSGVSPYQVPITSNSTTLYNGGTAYQHQWSQFQDPASGRGIGIMYTTSNNAQLYYFNSIPPGTNTGEILIDPANKKIELDPVKRATVNNFQQADDLTWKGAIVVTGDGKLPIYPTSGTTGLWILVEKLPTITVS